MKVFPFSLTFGLSFLLGKQGEARFDSKSTLFRHVSRRSVVLCQF